MKYGILLRGINVNGKKVEMPRLKTSLEQAGFESVTTLLNSGNAVLACDETSKDKVRVTTESAIESEFGLHVDVFVYSLPELERVVRDYPFDRTDPTWHAYAVFLNGDIGPELMAVANAQNQTAGSWQLGEGVLYWRTPKGTSITSEFSKVLTKAAYKTKNTVRNLNTIEKMIAVSKAQ